MRARDDLIPTRARETFERARNLIRAGSAVEGEALLRQLGELAPMQRVQAQAWIELGESLLRRGSAEDAASAFARSLAAWPDRPGRWRVRYWQGIALAESGAPGSAATALEAAAAEAPRHGRDRALLLRWCGWLHVGLGDLPSAQGVWQSALSAASSYPALADSLRLNMAEAHFALQEWQQVVDLLEVAVLPESQSPRRELLLGRANLELGREDRARSALDHLLSAWPHAPSVWLDEARVVLGWIALSRGETERALMYYRDVTGERLDDLPPSNYGSAVALIAEGRFAEAEKLLAPACPVQVGHPLFYPWVYALAYARFNIDRYGEAIESLEQFRGRVVADTLSRAAWSLRGDCYYRLEEAEEAYASYAKAASLLPVVPEMLLRRQSLAAIAAGRWGTAARILGDLIVRYPGTSHASEYNFWRAEVYYRLDRMEMARKHYQRAEQRGADAAQCAYALGWCDYKECRYPEALRQFDRAMRFCRDCPFLADLFIRRGNCLFNIGRIEEAAQAFADAVELAGVGQSSGLWAEASFRWAWALLRLEDFEAAQVGFARIQERERDTPLGAEALYWEGQAFFRQESYGDALKRFGLLLEQPAAHDSLRVRTLLASGDAYFNLGQYAAALEWYRQILEAPGADRTLRRTAHESLFECRGARGEWEQARLVLRELEEQFPESKGMGEKHLQVAEGYFREHHFREALASYGDFLERADVSDPRQLRVRFQMARCRERLGQLKQAAIAYEVLAEHEEFRHRSEAWLRAGMIHLQLGDVRMALRPLERRLSLDLDPQQAAFTRAYLAEAYQRLGEQEAARNEWEKVAHAGSGAPDSLRAVGSLHLGRMAFSEREWAAACEGFSKADSLGLVADIFRTCYWAGESAYRMGDTLRAVVWLERFLERGEREPLWEATARIRLAECYEGMDRASDAIVQYERVVGLPLQEKGLLEEARRRMRMLGAAPGDSALGGGSRGP